MMFRALVAMFVVSAASIAASAEECDVSGRYDVKIEWGARKCLAPDAWTVRLLVVKDGAGYAVMNPHGARFAVTSKVDGAACRMRLGLTVDHYTMGGGPADFVRYDLDLAVAGGRVVGGGGYEELGPDVQASAKCTDRVTVAGTRFPTVAGDLRFDEAAAKKDLVETLQSMAESCDLPYFEKPRKGSVQVEIGVLGDGGAQGFKLDGADQNLATACPGYERSFANRFENPSGKPQTLRFAVDLAQVHPRAKPKDMIVIPADRKPIATDEKDCIAALRDLESGDDESLRPAAKELCELRRKHEQARKRLLAAMGRIVAEYREQTNHDHAKNLPVTLKALGDIVKDCLAAVESQEWCHNVGCANEPEENAAFCDARAADVADAIVRP